MRTKTEDGKAPDPISDKMFSAFRDYVQENVGIKMPDGKRTLLQTRLQKRMRKLGINTFEAYHDYVFGSEGRETELVNMIDSVTTNKTDFFREPRHYEYLVREALPALSHIWKYKGQSKLAAWSAGCSSGEEPYTLAMVLSEFARAHREFQFSILATDISTRVLRHAADGIYDEQDILPVPMEMRKRYLLRSKNKQKTLVRIVPELRSRIRFQRLNFMKEKYDLREPVDVIFFRNVLIYFNRSTQEAVINRQCRHLRPGGYFFTGHSETLTGLNVPLVQVIPTIYQRK